MKKGLPIFIVAVALFGFGLGSMFTAERFKTELFEQEISRESTERVEKYQIKTEELNAINKRLEDFDPETSTIEELDAIMEEFFLVITTDPE